MFKEDVIFVDAYGIVIDRSEVSRRTYKLTENLNDDRVILATERFGVKAALFNA